MPCWVLIWLRSICKKNIWAISPSFSSLRVRFSSVYLSSWSSNHLNLSSLRVHGLVYLSSWSFDGPDWSMLALITFIPAFLPPAHPLSQFPLLSPEELIHHPPTFTYCVESQSFYCDLTLIWLILDLKEKVEDRKQSIKHNKQQQQQQQLQQQQQQQQ